MSSANSSSENIVSRKYDKCLADLVVKAGVGFSIGVIASVILFRRRAWPIALSAGFGMGAAYADCDRLFNPARVPGTRLVVIPPGSAPEAKEASASAPAPSISSPPSEPSSKSSPSSVPASPTSTETAVERQV